MSKHGRRQDQFIKADNLIAGSVIVIEQCSERKTVIWSEHERVKSVLKIMLSAVQGWNIKKTLTRYGKDNLGSTAIIDANANNDIRVFWAASVDEFPDVYTIRSTGNTWSSPSRMNERNEVLDYSPSAINTLDGDIEVT